MTDERRAQLELLGRIKQNIMEASQLCQKIATLTFEFRDHEEGEDLQRLHSSLQQYSEKFAQIGSLAKDPSLDTIMVPESLLRHIDEGRDPLSWLKDIFVELKNVNEAAHGRSQAVIHFKQQLNTLEKNKL